MSEPHCLVHLETDGTKADERLVREYVFDAIDRLTASATFGNAGFVRAGQKPGDGGLVLLRVEGAVDDVVEHERERWDALVDRGLLRDWRAVEAPLASVWGPKGAVLWSRLDEQAARSSRVVYDEFESGIDPVDEHPAEAAERDSRTGVGWWTFLHLLSLQRGYYYDDEVDAYATGIREVTRKLAQYEGPATARAKLDEVIDGLERARAEFE